MEKEYTLAVKKGVGVRGVRPDVGRVPVVGQCLPACLTTGFVGRMDEGGRMDAVDVGVDEINAAEGLPTVDAVDDTHTQLSSGVCSC